MKGTIISFGCPRSGTTLIDRMLLSNKYITSIDIGRQLPYIDDDPPNRYSEVSMQEVRNLGALFKLVHFRITEVNTCHPMNSQVWFNWVVERVSQPVYLIRTNRSAVDIHKSLMVIGEEINMKPRFLPCNLWSSVGLILSEYAGYLTIRDYVNIVSLEYEKLGDSKYLKNSLMQIGFTTKVVNECVEYMKGAYNKLPVRTGRLSMKTDIELPKEEESILLAVDRMREML